MTIEVTGRYDGKVEGQHAGRIDTTVTGGDAYDGQVTGGTGRDDEFVVAGTPFTPGTLRGYQVRIVGGTGAGQVRYDLEQHRERHHGRGGLGRPAGQPPASTGSPATPRRRALGQVGGTVVTVDPDRTTITLGGGVTLPTADGGLSGALIRIVGDGLTGAALLPGDRLQHRAHASRSPTPGAPAVHRHDGTSVVVARRPRPVRRPDHRRSSPTRTPPASSSRRAAAPRGWSRARPSVLDGLSDSYTVRLTRDPGSETITITLAPLATPSLDGANATGTCGLDTTHGAGCNLEQVALRRRCRPAAAQQRVAGADLRQPATGTSRRPSPSSPIDDTVVDGSDLQEFADSAQRAHPRSRARWPSTAATTPPRPCR